MKSFTVAVFDNDYNALVERVIINAKSKDVVDTWCAEQRWSGYDYMCIDELDCLSTNPKLEILNG